MKELPNLPAQAGAYNPQEVEDKIYEKWEESGCFKPEALNNKFPHTSLCKRGESNDTYSIVMPPPNVTGILHMGSAMMLAIEDLMVRYHRMKGDKTLWIPGTDHAAIATQTRVEKDLKKKGLTRHSLGREKFLEKVEEFVDNQRNIIKSQMRKMGSSCDWTREAYTMDETRSKAVRMVFKMMYDDGLIYRGERVVNWCPRCASTLADDEVEYKAQKTKLYTFRYAKDFPFAVATTRPETKLGDTAVAVNPKDDRYKEYIGKTFEVDFCGLPAQAGIPLKLKIIGNRNVDMEFGTGALGVTPAHSMVDWQMAEENGLKIAKVINEDGKIRDGFKEFSGKTVLEAREMTVEKLREAGLLEKEEDIGNNLSLCYRCYTPVEPLSSLQWFIDVNKKISKYGKSIKELSVEAVRTGVFGRDKIKIVPERFEKNYFHWMDNLRDWCVSRQIWYGHRVPVWYKVNKTTKQDLPAQAGNNKTKIKEEDIKEIYVGVEEPEGEGWAQDEDTLDTWFSSGMWTFSTMAHSPEQIRLEDGKLIIDSEDFKMYHPTSVLETMYDILFFWVARMIIMTTYAIGDIPFQDVYMHGCVRDKFGDKMSKSKPETCIDPLEVSPKYGMDAVRLSLIIGSTPGNDTKVYEEKIAGFRNFTNKLWNISRYVLGAMDRGGDGEGNSECCRDGASPRLKENGLTLADRWILGKLESVVKSVTDDVENYRFSQAGETLREFTWNDFADWYLEASKFEKAPRSPRPAELRDKGDCGGAVSRKDEILMFVLKNLLKLWHPFMPFVTEKIWEEMGNDKMLIVEEWPTQENNKTKKQQNKEMEDDFELIKNIITSIRNARAQYNIKPSEKVKVVIYAGDKKELVESQSALVKKLRTGVDELEIAQKGEKQKNAIYIAINGVEIYLIVPDLDFSAEIERLEKEIEGQEKRIAGQKKKMENKDFIERAPKKVVDGEKEKLALWEDALRKMREQLEHLK
ncbi:valine--tRNA ligase [Candidatus Falkowbacteria bacterium RBG_13_39_14]|uniref:Valine--tRNA ligase n=1 Tax=Candidatus Falkowbacteria bacterium RBG_13_39_14 TaxID=1797985 RepID=A0A1F5S501_9BACT|nr:MAG: valine--tRNA ligase [Candidatus Falkowbacteria bacterium RBG_13_39_14]